MVHRWKVALHKKLLGFCTQIASSGVFIEGAITMGKRACWDLRRLWVTSQIATRDAPRYSDVAHAQHRVPCDALVRRCLSTKKHYKKLESNALLLKETLSHTYQVKSCNAKIRCKDMHLKMPGGKHPHSAEVHALFTAHLGYVRD